MYSISLYKILNFIYFVEYLSLESKIFYEGKEYNITQYNTIILYKANIIPATASHLRRVCSLLAVNVGSKGQGPSIFLIFFLWKPRTFYYCWLIIISIKVNLIENEPIFLVPSSSSWKFSLVAVIKIIGSLTNELNWFKIWLHDYILTFYSRKRSE